MIEAMRIGPLVGVLLAMPLDLARAGDCADTGMVATVLTPPDTTLDQEGGVVVGLVEAPTSRTIPELAKLPWQFCSGKRCAPPRVLELVPGLATLAPKAPEPTLDLEDDRHHSRVHLGFAYAAYDDRPIDAAPKLARATYTEGVRHHATTQTTTLELAAPVPADMVAMIAYGKPGSPRSWARIAPGQTTVVIWHAEPCRGQAKGTMGSPAASELVVAYVSSRGHISLLSTPITVKRTP